jgi:hypothetical protein
VVTLGATVEEGDPCSGLKNVMPPLGYVPCKSLFVRHFFSSVIHHYSQKDLNKDNQIELLSIPVHISCSWTWDLVDNYK